MRRADAGFTLMEVVVALALAGGLLLGARWMLAAAGDGAERVIAEAGEADRAANAERLLRDLALRTEARFREGPRFRGDGRAVRWGSWCDVPAGWQERCEVTLALLRGRERNVLALSLPGGALVPVRAGFSDGKLLYLRSAREGGIWADRWDSDPELPLAIGVVLDRDTLLVRIGRRG
jgi:prepilin-type N-terminal cleavage/methylation domain-containing protein